MRPFARSSWLAQIRVGVSPELGRAAPDAFSTIVISHPTLIQRLTSMYRSVIVDHGGEPLEPAYEALTVSQKVMLRMVGGGGDRAGLIGEKAFVPRLDDVHLPFNRT